MAERFGVVLKKRLTPMKSGTELRKAPTDYTAKRTLRHQYQELVGSMMWPATITRGDIAATVSKLAMYLTNHREGLPYRQAAKDSQDLRARAVRARQPRRSWAGRQ